MENLFVNIKIIDVHFEKMSNMTKKREKDWDRDREMKSNIWDVIEYIQNLDDKISFKTTELLNTKANMEHFLKMTPDERLSWINFN